VEFRDRRWLCDEIFDILASHRAALCVHDMIEDHPRPVTTNWVYLRFHGNRYRGSYYRQYLTASEGDPGLLGEGARRLCLFHNDLQGYAVRNAADLRRYVSEA
jgi:uncharacterized protein YecE (DUF72 family)